MPQRSRPSTLQDPGKPDNASPDNLVLDPDNPRLAQYREGNQTLTQADILRILWTEMAVEEVALSVAANGYFQHEPLLVTPAPGQTGKFVVVEGNRRLAAVQILLSSDLRNALKATDLPALTDEVRKNLTKLPIRIYPDRRNIWSYIGFRHLHGVKPWDALSKAKYAVQIHELYGIPLKEIAERIGDRHSTVERLYRGYMVLRQAEEKTGFDVGDIYKGRFAFSHLYTGLDGTEFQRFLGLKDGAPPTKENPVAKKKLDNLRELMLWLYGSQKLQKEPVVKSQNPDLWNLAEALGKPQGLVALRRGYSLAQASEVAKGDERRFRESLVVAKENLRVAVGSVIGYRGEADLYAIVQDIAQMASSLEKDMASQRKGPKPRK